MYHKCLVDIEDYKTEDRLCFQCENKLIQSFLILKYNYQYIELNKCNNNPLKILMYN